ncbi:hypothetical protein NGA_0269602 [Nannochloropsis gaditana CCMP526]|uniref:uncharacterized protein n=1 Tax=Nannochloropsis gaditana (strain CCMP526) TaxID=1093141 RepID=UPI00029F73EF|nr:hypothetical protein NGA_0269602 [Nannochloropsis gaditana CCMP526]EKU22837.1 hypothetical protein NGA_0269602 [Nannochloropsis gaditana CCMP526]|eukprot:XP_005853520.1 hypothetical protein NGA_0269602 [Nannochloropsis gaditana CCMP526]
MVISSKRRRIPYLFLFLFFSIVLLLAWAPRSMAAKAKNAKTKDTIKQKKGQKEQKSPQMKKQGETATPKRQQKQQQRPREKLEDLSLMDDTKENRQYHAARVMKGTPLIEILEGLVQEAARLKGSEAAEEIRKAILESDTRALTQVMEKAYAGTFSAEELAFIADYSNSEVGKRVQRKMSQYVAKVTPAMEAFTKEVFSGPGLQGQGQGPQEWQDQQALYSSKGTTVYMNEGKPKGRQKEQGKKRAAARAGPASANGGDGEL